MGAGQPSLLFFTRSRATSVTVCLVGERGEPGRSESILMAVWLEDGRVGLALEWNIPLRCGLDSSVKIWRTEPLQPG